MKIVLSKVMNILKGIFISRIKLSKITVRLKAQISLLHKIKCSEREEAGSNKNTILTIDSEIK